ncbi:triafestin-1-like [Rhodnius prolixus]|uniref:triafestin-1-like n=1 Tax=Rhodnius prolixus TaxID=13249 RepID=UPI003D18BD8B
MKMIIVLAIFATLTFATADSQIKPKECLKVPVKQNFEPQKYFRGNWFLFNIKREEGQSNTTVCQESKSRMLEDGTISHVIYAYSDVLKPEFIQINCTGNVKNTQEKILFQCTLRKEEVTENFQMEGTVAESDYENFAVFYICSKEGDGFLVLSRKEDSGPTDPRVTETLKKYGMNLEEFISRKNVKCKSHPDF